MGIIRRIAWSTLCDKKVFPHCLEPSANAAGKGGVLAAASVGYLLYSVAALILRLAIRWGCLTGWISVSILWDAFIGFADGARGAVLGGAILRVFFFVHQDLLAVAVYTDHLCIRCGY